MTIFVRACFTAHDGGRAGFERIAFALQEQAKAEPGTRTFRWFPAGEGRYIVLEEYADTAAALAHNERAEPLLAEVPQHAELVSAELYGPIGPELHAWARSTPGVTTYPDLQPAGSS
ncbi:putative quinol monooxygenase [Flindersiella endophytica]